MVAVDPDGLAPYGPLRHGVVIVGALAVVAVSLARGSLRWSRWPTLALVGVVGLMALAAVFGVDPTQAFLGTAERRLGVVGWIVIAAAFVAGQSVDAERRSVVLHGLVAAALALGGAAVAEWWFWAPPGLDPGIDRLSSTMGNPAFAGAAGILLLPVAIGVAVDRRSARGWRVVGALSSASVVVVVVGSGSRAAWVGVVVVGVVLVMTRRDRWSPPMVTAALFGVAGVVLLGIVVGPVDERISSLTGGPGGLDGRLDEWRIGIAAVAERPVLGAGPEGYRVVFPTVVDERYVVDNGREVITDRAHAGPLDVVLTGGLGAGLSWVLWWAMIGDRVRRGLRAPAATAGLAAGVGAYGVAQLGLFPIIELDVIAAAMAGVLVASTAAPGELRTVRVPAWAGPVGVAACVGVAVLAGAGVVADRRAASALGAAVRGSDTAVATARRAVDLRPDMLPHRIVLARTQAGQGTQAGARDAVATLDAALRRSPQDPALVREQGEMLVRLATLTRIDDDIDRARRELAAVTERDPYDPTTWLQIASVEVLGGDLDRGLTSWRRAADLAPGAALPLVEAGRALLAEGRPDEAVVWLDEAVEREPDDAEARRLRSVAVAAADPS